MLRKLAILPVLLATALSLAGFSSFPATMAEEEGIPWWMWLLILFVLAVFAAFALWWWIYAEKEEEAGAPPAKPEPVPDTQTVEVEVPEVEVPKAEAPEPEPSPEPPQPDDLKRIEGIGPKISSVLQDAGIATFAQLAAVDVEQLKEILGEADPNLLRLADPTTWPEQARLAAEGQWDALEQMQGELKGGRYA